MWKDSQVSSCRTHHRVGQRPLYAQRFIEVLKFHEPGLAPARDDSGAYHIDPLGNPAYAQRFLRSFGYYEGLAAVQTKAGWRHIDSEGEPLGSQVFDWCGNFQGGRCAVRQAGRYFHIQSKGERAYSQDYCYVGDFRDSVAAVQREDGLHSHIDLDGKQVHDSWFLDLDVFHKGFARARDKGGWHHIDENGQAQYKRRFAMVEPFYNGQARVECFNGSLLVIDELGQTMAELRAATEDEFHALSADLVGFWKTETIAVAVKLGVFEAIPGTSEELAARCQSEPSKTLRLLRALEELQLVRKDGEAWRATEKGRYLREAHHQSLAAAAVEYRDFLCQSWRSLDLKLSGQMVEQSSVFQVVANDRARRAAHHKMLSSYARHDYHPLVTDLPIESGDRVCDVGGGTGVLATLIADQFPDCRVELFDLPSVAADCLDSRVHAYGGDFFEKWPMSADVIVLARVLHDWCDDDAERIIERAREALKVGGRLVIIEMTLSEDSPHGSLCDLHLLAVTGGRERTLTEFGNLLSKSGFTLTQVLSGGGLCHVLIAMRQGDQ